MRKNIVQLINVMLLLIGYGHSIIAYEELPLAVIIPSYNNAERYALTLDSVFSQKYENFRVVYIDDVSPDGTGDLVEQYIKEHGLEYKCTLIRNKERCRKLKNIYNAIHSCDDREIVVQIDGDDWLAHDHVFADINKAYQTSDIWLTYGQYRNVPKEEAIKWGKKEIEVSEPVPQLIIDNRQFRKYKWLYRQLRTFYAWLFKLIKLEDLLAKNVSEFAGKFYPASIDQAMMYSMLEMAHYRFEFIPDIAYIRNIYSPIVTFKVEKEMQIILKQEVRAKSKYGVVKEPIVGRIDALHDAKADLVILSNQPTQLSNLLASVDHHVSGIGQVHVIYTIHNDEIEQLYKEVEQRYSNTHFIKFTSYDNENVTTYISDCIATSPNNYIICAHDALVINDAIDANKCIKLLEQTFAYAFYMGLSYEAAPFNKDKNIPCQHLIDDMYAWKFSFGMQKWRSFNNVDMTLYRKQDILKNIASIRCNSLEEFKDSLNKTSVYVHKVGLFFQYPKIEHAL